MDVGTLSKYSIGSDIHTAAMSFAAGAPLDDRFVVRNKESLISKKVFGEFGHLYSGLVVTVSNTGTAYVLKTDTTKPANNFLKEDSWFENASDQNIQAVIDANWAKLASDSDLQNLKSAVSGVFQFKGVATAIDPDHTTLTIGKGTVSGAIGIAPDQTSFNDLPLVSYGTVLSENLGSVMYAWGTPGYGILFYTEKPYTVSNPTQSQFDKSSEESELKYIDVYDTLYFYSGSVGIQYSTGNDAEGNPTTATRTYTVWEAINNGGTLYSLSGSIGIIDIYATTSSDSTLPNPLISEVTVQNYKYWEFTKQKENKFTVAISSDITTETAKPENNGHVYQLREEEYASNGQMWVQLGSPKTDWIVL